MGKTNYAELSAQLIYLDFDGAETTYINRDLDIALNVTVIDSGFSLAEQQYIISTLSEKYQDRNIVFTSDQPLDGGLYSTVYIGKTSDFDQYGSFLGLAETIDKGNQIKNDNAFVMLDSDDGSDLIISVIDHELGHIVDGEEHFAVGGNLDDYAKVYDEKAVNGKTQLGTISESSTIRGKSAANEIDGDKYVFTSGFSGRVTFTLNSSSLSTYSAFLLDANNSVVANFGLSSSYTASCNLVSGQTYTIWVHKQSSTATLLSYSINIDFSTGNVDPTPTPDPTPTEPVLNLVWADTFDPVAHDNAYYTKYQFEGDTTIKVLFYLRNESSTKSTAATQAIVTLGGVTKTVYIPAMSPQTGKSYSCNIATSEVGSLTNATLVVTVGNEIEYGAKPVTVIYGDVEDITAPTTPGRLSSSSTTGNIYLDWADSTDNVRVAGYEIRYHRPGKTGTVTYQTRTTSASNYTFAVSELREGWTYEWQVRAYDAAGNYSDWSTAQDFTVPKPAEPDLYIAEMTLSSDSVSTEQSISVAFTVENKGDAAAAATRLYVYIDNNYMGDVVVSALAAGGSYSGTYVIAAGRVAVGEHTIKIESDATNLVSESNESNNSDWDYLYVNEVVRAADLQVSAVSVTDSSIAADEAVTLNFTVKNDGNASALSSYAYIYDGDTLLGQVVVGSLTAGASFNGSFKIAGGTLSAGPHDLRVVADATCRVTESNEDNNSKTVELTVERGVEYDIYPYKPSDWGDRVVISNVSGSFSDGVNMTEDDEIFISFALTADSTEDVIPTFYSAIYIDGEFFDRWRTSDLQQGYYQYVDSYSIGKLAAGVHTIEITVDCDNSLTETDETNNTYSKLFVVGSSTRPKPEPVPLGEVEFFVGNFDDGSSDMLLAARDGKISIYNHTSCWSELSLDSTWEVVGTVDINYDACADILLKHTSGLIAAGISQGDGTFVTQTINLLGEGWDIEATGDFDGDGNGDVLVADPDASAVIGLIGYWKDGTTWTLIDGYSPEWDMISAGDYDGDGITDMLWRNTFTGADGHTYNAYCSWIMENSNSWRIVSSSRPDQWDYLCSGDFDGDSITDMAMINSDGVVGVWKIEEGTLAGWTVLGTVDLSVNKFAGVGDFDGNSCDDIVWCNTATSEAVSWQIEYNAIRNVQSMGVIA